MNFTKQELFIWFVLYFKWEFILGWGQLGKCSALSKSAEELCCIFSLFFYIILFCTVQLFSLFSRENVLSIEHDALCFIIYFVYLN